MRVEVGVHALEAVDHERGLVVVIVVVTQPGRVPIVAARVEVCAECGRERPAHRRRACTPAGW